MKKFRIEYKYTYSDEAHKWETDEQDDAYVYYNDMCKSISTAWCAMYRDNKLVTEYKKK